MTVPSTSATPLSRPAQAPQRFGQYLLVRKLAQGGMAEIYLAKKLGVEGFERNVVIKCMLEHLSRNQEFVSMFLDEARLAAQLIHPNIAQITDLGIADGRHFICMEYLAGEDLESLLGYARHKGQLVPIPLAARIIHSVLEGLEFAHGYQEQGRPLELVHRDISPSNIFVTFQGTVKLLDFGIAKAASRLTHTEPGTLKGKLGYMSPEQAQSDEIDARSDLFSLGITFHELLTGRRVFELNDEVRVLVALMNQPVEPPSLRRPEIPPALDRIVLKATERQREKRYASAAEMRADLEEFLQSMPMAPGMSQLAQFVQGLVGPAVVERKTKVPTLSELMAQGVAAEEDIGTARTLVRSTSQSDVPLYAVQAPDTGARRTTPTSVTPVPQQSTARPALLSALLAGLLALGGTAWYLLSSSPTPVAAAPEPPAPPPPPPAPVPVPAATPPAPPRRAAAPARKQPAKQKTPPPPAPQGSDALNQVMEEHYPELLACGDQHLTDLTSKLRVDARMKIKSSGEMYDLKISGSAPLPPDLVTCLQSKIEEIRFPPIPDALGVRYNFWLEFEAAEAEP